jgi:hypothetical protein
VSSPMQFKKAPITESLCLLFLMMFFMFLSFRILPFRLFYFAHVMPHTLDFLELLVSQNASNVLN